MKTREYLAIKRRIDDFELAESLTRSKLIQGARAGNVVALGMLQQRYNLRLPLVETVELFDIYQDEKALGQGRISMAYTVTYRDPQQTLTDKDVNALHEQVRARLASALGAELR